MNPPEGGGEVSSVYRSESGTVTGSTASAVYSSKSPVVIIASGMLECREKQDEPIDAKTSQEQCSK